jgi:hypothetical protein
MLTWHPLFPAAREFYIFDEPFKAPPSTPKEWLIKSLILFEMNAVYSYLTGFSWTSCWSQVQTVSMIMASIFNFSAVVQGIMWARMRHVFHETPALHSQPLFFRYGLGFFAGKLLVAKYAESRK